MIELKQGDPKNLKGRVLVYSIFQDKGKCELPDYIQDGSIFAVYAATDPADFKQKTGASEHEIAEIEKRNKEMEELLKQKFDEETLKQIGDDIQSTPLYSNQVLIGHEKEIFDRFTDDDILFTDKYSSVNKCPRSVVLALHFYMMSYDENVIKGMDINGTVENVMIETYKDFHGQELMEKLRFYVGAYMDAVNYNRTQKGYDNEVKRIRNEFFAFFSGSPFIETLINLRGIIETDHSQRLELVELYYEQIQCIEDEAFERVIEIRKNIDDILKE